jgi:hypothetical protein
VNDVRIEMRRALNCIIAASLMIAVLWLLDLPDATSWAILAVVGTGIYWADAELKNLRTIR